jgi:DNA-binding NarL/FixJ family response regulator
MITVYLGESSYIVRKGILQLLGEFAEIGKIIEFSSANEMGEALENDMPDIVIANTFFDHKLRESISYDQEQTPIILYLYHSPLPHGETPTHLSIFEDKGTLVEKIQRAVDVCIPNKGETGEELSPREKLVLKEVALGHTNKEIADTLFISTHTVISHRKNITKKLGIKTVSGLTVYAILNKLIGMEDIS